MSTTVTQKRKRPQADQDSNDLHNDPGMHPSRQAYNAPKKPRIGSAAQQPSTLSVNSLKSRLRSLNRLLAADDTGDTKTKLPANVRSVQERELAALKSQIKTIDAQKQRRKTLERYHAIRFFERRKAERALKKAERALAALDKEEDTKDLKDRKKKAKGLVFKCKVDMNYTVYSPLGWKYSSLYVGNKEGVKDADNSDEQDTGVEQAEDKDVAAVTRGDPIMWARVAEATKQGQHALDELREAVDGYGGPVDESDANELGAEDAEERKQRQQLQKAAKKEKKAKERNEEPKPAHVQVANGAQKAKQPVSSIPTDVPAPKNRKERRAMEKAAGLIKDHNNTSRKKDDEDEEIDDGGFFE